MKTTTAPWDYQRTAPTSQQMAEQLDMLARWSKRDASLDDKLIHAADALIEAQDALAAAFLTGDPETVSLAKAKVKLFKAIRKELMAETKSATTPTAIVAETPAIVNN